MKDMNFFNEFLQAKAKARSNRLKGVIGAAVFFAVIILVYLFFAMQEMSVSDDLERVEQLLLNPAFSDADREIAQLDSRINALNNYKTALTEVDRRISNFYDFTAEENYKIVNAFPRGILLERFSINGNSFTANGFTLDINIIPALVENLKGTGLFISIYPPETDWIGIKEEDETDRDIDEYLQVVEILSRQLGYDEYTIRGMRGIYEFSLQGVLITPEGGQ